MTIVQQNKQKKNTKRNECEERAKARVLFSIQNVPKKKEKKKRNKRRAFGIPTAKQQQQQHQQDKKAKML